ncbi:unnamed protein product [Schistosoma bovis]|nr:unnamed protein product [Schistosoma bovis]
MNDSQQKNSCPFIRVVTHKIGILVHLGQLVSLSEDQKSFIMRNVISFDPLRVHERTISTLEPAEILALTESKLQSQHGKRGNLLSDYLQNQMMFNTSVNSSFLKCPTSTPHLINGRSEASSRWYDNGIVSITIQQSSTNSTMNHSNSLLKPRQKTPVKDRSLK